MHFGRRGDPVIIVTSKKKKKKLIRKATGAPRIDHEKSFQYEEAFKLFERLYVRTRI